MRFHLGPWVWNSGEEGEFWSPPAAASLGALDLRSPDQCAAAGGVPLGVGIFVTPDGITDLGAAYNHLGQDPDRILTAAQRAGWETRTGLPATSLPAGTTLREALLSTLGPLSDPAGGRCLPLVPNTRRDWEVWLAGLRVGRRTFDPGDVWATPLRDLLRRVYRELRQRVEAGDIPLSTARKRLGWLLLKYGISKEFFLPAEYAGDEPLPPETTLTDNFDRTNDADLSVGAPYTYTDVIGDLGITGNAVRPQGALGDNVSRAESDLSGDDNYSQCAVADTGVNASARWNGPCCRFSGSAVDCYIGRQNRVNDPSSTYRIYKIVASVFTALGAGATPATETGVKRIEASGSAIRILTDAVEDEAITDTALTAGLRAGFGINGSSATNVRLDDWEAGDLAVGGHPAMRRLLARHFRPVEIGRTGAVVV